MSVSRDTLAARLAETLPHLAPVDRAIILDLAHPEPLTVHHARVKREIARARRRVVAEALADAFAAWHPDAPPTTPQPPEEHR